jgi:hypothetical protein
VSYRLTPVNNSIQHGPSEEANSFLTNQKNPPPPPFDVTRKFITGSQEPANEELFINNQFSGTQPEFSNGGGEGRGLTLRLYII